ncbi:hypothetical protein CHS0354_008219 [Potamilus streckersoni]|uniref:Sulfatase N-terminal domain-containing protein n=1 Tax=Potamilus streckersoni TaxID=2493646 RepID=A0AAE0RWG8_9BIVA|nr:hypothetical protein CHS0354_008219 [Potamilus streckersoni]
MKEMSFPVVHRQELLLILLCMILNGSSANAQRPNIVFFLTDDQDVALGGQTPMTKTKSLLGDKGIIFNNMFVTSPLCCPSRSSILSGRYVHNHKGFNNSLEGGCSDIHWQQTQEPTAFPAILKAQGYTTFFAGKYLNQYGFPKSGGVEHIPPGWDWWTGLVGNSQYYGYSLSVNGTLEKHGDNYKKDYLTDLIYRHATEFLRFQTKDHPFFMMLSTPACHAPFTPAPQYENNYANMSAPRTASYNVKAEDKHWLIRQAIVPMPNDTVKSSDDIFRNRWRTLLSVDDMVESVLMQLQDKGLLDNTYLFFSSDNGFHLGQFGLPSDKRQLYDFDIRVPLMVRGPGITPGQVSEQIILNIDFSPTFIELTGGQIPKDIDGISMVPILKKNTSTPLQNIFLVEHYGEYEMAISGCPQYKDQYMANCNGHCVCEDSRNNTYGCVIQITDASSFKYCKMEDLEFRTRIQLDQDGPKQPIKTELFL